LRFFPYIDWTILAKIDQEMRPWECRQTDRQTQRHTEVIICPMLYAIAMGQIIAAPCSRVSRMTAVITSRVNGPCSLLV